MIRLIIADEQQATRLGPGREVDTFLDRVVKYTPVEMLIAWVAVKGVVESTAPPHALAILWVCFVAGVILTVVLATKQTAVPGELDAVRHVAIMKVAFIIWTIALGEPFTGMLGRNFQSLIGPLLLVCYMVLVAAVVKNPDPSLESVIAKVFKKSNPPAETRKTD